MKLQLIRDQSEAIEGFKSVLATSFMPPSVDDVIDNSCELIIMSDVLDMYPQETRNSALVSVVKKLRLNGELSLSGVEARALSKMYANNLISTEGMCSIFSATNSLLELDQAISILEQCQLEVETSKVNGYKYELKARRIY